MYEAHALGRWINAALKEAGVRDGGAEYTITVTDTAGNVGTIIYEDDRWAFDDGLFAKRLASQLPAEERKRLEKEFAKLP